MLKINKEVLNIEGLDKHISFVKRMMNMTKDKKFQRFIQTKVMETLNEVMNERLTGGTTNDDQIELYKNSNHIVEFDEGFILYNDAKIPANVKDDSSYPDGMFSIALAFEYGVGIIGDMTNDNKNAWDYNINNYNFGWYFKDLDGLYKQTAGYMGFEVYRYTADRIQKNLNSWINEYYRKEV